MLTKEIISENLFTSTPGELQKIREWMLNNEFNCDTIRPNLQTKFDAELGEFERAELGFHGEYTKARRFKQKFVGVFITNSKYQKRKVFLTEVGNVWYEFNHPDDVIKKIAEYYSLSV